jgi:hypothetical protein
LILIDLFAIIEYQFMTHVNPEGKYEQYIGKFADLLGIFWQYHKEVLANNSPFPLPFAMQYDGGKLIDFNPQTEFDKAKAEGKNYNPIIDYDMAVATSLIQSWFRFVADLGIRNQSKFAERLADGTFFSIPYDARRFGLSYTQNLFNEVQQLGEEVSNLDPVINSRYTVTEIGAHGIDTGSVVVNRFLAVLGETVNPSGAIKAARTRFEDLEGTRRSLGVPEFSPEDVSVQNAVPLQEPRYDGFADTPSGVNEKVLQQFGYQQEGVSGCPAARRVSEPTRKFLSERGITNSPPPMLTDFLLMNKPVFETRVRSWYNALSPEDKNVISPYERAVLEGKRNPHKEGARCPFPRKEG